MSTNKSNSPTNHSDSDLKKIKKVVKHSRKFVRTQTGCLQCRQKKKKCDGKRPTCLSCEKRGISCEFPANIRFFQFQAPSETKNPQKSTTTNNLNSQSPIVQPLKKARTNSFITENEFNKKDLIKLESDTSLKDLSAVKEDDKSFQFQNEVIEVLNKPSSVKIERTQSFLSTTSESSISSFQLQSRSSSLSSIAPSLISDNSDTESIISSSLVNNDHLASRSNSLISGNVDQEKHVDHTEEALTLANDGESINKILNNISIELIKRSIQNLKYINFEEKINNYQLEQATSINNSFEISKHIKEGLQFVERNSTMNFKPEEYLSFDD